MGSSLSRPPHTIARATYPPYDFQKTSRRARDIDRNIFFAQKDRIGGRNPNSNTRPAGRFLSYGSIFIILNHLAGGRWGFVRRRVGGIYLRESPPRYLRLFSRATLLALVLKFAAYLPRSSVRAIRAVACLGVFYRAGAYLFYAPHLQEWRRTITAWR